MKNIICYAVIVFFICLGTFAHAQSSAMQEQIKLPAPQYSGTLTVEKALKEISNVRTYKSAPLSLTEVSQVLWAARAITEPGRGLRTVPSAPYRYPLIVYLFAGNVTGLKPGMYRYIPESHSLVLVASGDMKRRLFDSTGQAPIGQAPAGLVIAGYSMTLQIDANYYEAGRAAQNVFLEGVSLGIGTIGIRGFDSNKVNRDINLPAEETALYIMPLGKK